MAAMRAVLLLAALAAGAAALRTNVDFNDREWKERPVAKVIGLLKDMQASLEEEASKDAELYDQLVCWCETNDKEKTKAIADGEQKSKDLTALSTEKKALNDKLTSDIKALSTEIAGDTKGLQEATAVREKELAEFNQNEKDAIASLQSLKGAITTLSKHQAGAALAQQAALVELTHHLRRTSEAEKAVLPHQRRLLRSLLAHPQGMVSLLQQSGGARAAAPSDEIFGMLSQMKETFETNMETGKKEEEQSAKSYVELKETKTAEIKAGKNKVLTKTEEAADAQQTAATADADLEATTEALAADREFLANLKKTCAGIDKQWEARSKMRQEEITAVSETIAFLTSDEAHDQFSKSFSLFQLRAEAQRTAAVREQARQFLVDAGNRLHSKKISYLATRMRFDPFGAMRQNIDNMVGALGKEKEDEIHHKDDCVGDFNENEKSTVAKTEHKEDVETEMNTLEAEITEKTEEEKALEAEIYQAQLELQTAGANREKENKEFQVTIADQRATQAILGKALARLQEFYDKKAAASLLQRRAHVARQGQTPPVQFEEYKKADGGGAVALIQSIIDESKAVEKDAIGAETDAQTAYEGFVKDSHKEIAQAQSGIVADEEIISKDKAEDEEDKVDRRATVEDILKLGEYNQGLHSSCDFTLNNFEVRQQTRDSEVEALKQSKAIFSGAGFGGA